MSNWGTNRGHQKTTQQQARPTRFISHRWQCHHTRTKMNWLPNKFTEAPHQSGVKLVCPPHRRPESTSQRPKEAWTAYLRVLQPEIPPSWHGAHQLRSTPSTLECLNDNAQLAVASRCISFQFANKIHQVIMLGLRLLSSCSQRSPLQVHQNTRMLCEALLLAHPSSARTLKNPKVWQSLACYLEYHDLVEAQ